MRKTITFLALGLLSSGAWAHDALFDNVDNQGGILNQINTLPPGMAMQERGEGEFYGTSLKDWGGGVTVGRETKEVGSGEVYGSILFDANPKLPY